MPVRRRFKKITRKDLLSIAALISGLLLLLLFALIFLRTINVAPQSQVAAAWQSYVSLGPSTWEGGARCFGMPYVTSVRIGAADIYAYTPSSAVYAYQQYNSTYTGGATAVMSGDPVTVEWSCLPSTVWISTWVEHFWYRSDTCNANGPYTSSVTNNVTITGPDIGTITRSDLTGSYTFVPAGPAGSTRNYSVTCQQAAGYGYFSSVPMNLPIVITAANLTIAPNPAVMKTGSSSIISWTATNAAPGSCTVTGPAPWATWNETVQQFTAAGSFPVNYANLGGALAVYVYGAGGGGGGGGSGSCSNGAPGSASSVTSFGSPTPLSAGAGGAGGAGLSNGTGGAAGGAGTASGGDTNIAGGAGNGGAGGAGIACYSGLVGGAGGSGGSGGYVYKYWPSSGASGAPTNGTNVAVAVGGSPGGGSPNGSAGGAGKVVVTRGPVAQSVQTPAYPSTGNYTYTLTCTAPENGLPVTQSTTVAVNAACPTNYVDDGSGNCVCPLFGLGGSTCVSSCTDPHSHAQGSNCVCDSGYTYNSTTGTCTNNATPQLNASNLTILVNGLASARVKRGASVPVTWSVSNLVNGDSNTLCSVTAVPASGFATQSWGHTGTSWANSTTPTPTATINQKMTFTLSCTNASWATPTISKSASASLIPTVIEI